MLLWEERNKWVGCMELIKMQQRKGHQPKSQAKKKKKGRVHMWYWAEKISNCTEVNQGLVAPAPPNCPLDCTVALCLCPTKGRVLQQRLYYVTVRVPNPKNAGFTVSATASLHVCRHQSQSQSQTGLDSTSRLRLFGFLSSAGLPLVFFFSFQILFIGPKFITA